MSRRLSHAGAVLRTAAPIAATPVRDVPHHYGRLRSYAYRSVRLPLLAAALIATVVGCTKSASDNSTGNKGITDPPPPPALLSGDWDMNITDLVSRDGTASCFTPVAITVRFTQSGPTITGTTGAGTLSCTNGNFQLPAGQVVDGRLDATQLRFSISGWGANVALTGTVYGTPPSSIEGSISTSYNSAGAVVAYDGSFQATKR